MADRPKRNRHDEAADRNAQSTRRAIKEGRLGDAAVLRGIVRYHADEAAKADTGKEGGTVEPLFIKVDEGDSNK